MSTVMSKKRQVPTLGMMREDLIGAYERQVVNGECTANRVFLGNVSTFHQGWGNMHRMEGTRDR